MAEEANIDAYFERIGFAGSIAPTLETLGQLIQLHTAAIPFENLDPLIGAPVRLELRDLQQKLLFDGRGGYCLEQNLLFKAVLESLDYEVKAIGARVLWGRGEDEEAPETHLVLLVDVSGVNYLADVGFGVLTPTAPLRLRAEVEQATPHETFQLHEADGTWRLEAQVDGNWAPLYAFEVREKTADDLKEMNEQVSARPPFNDTLMAARAEKGRRVTLSNTRLAIYPTGGATETRMLASVAELREVLGGTFGISLPGDERLEPALERVIAAAQAGTP